MKLIVWTPNDRHGKNRVQEHGSTWEVVTESPDQFQVRSLCFTFLNEGHYEKDLRWIPKEECAPFIGSSSS